MATRTIVQLTTTSTASRPPRRAVQPGRPPLQIDLTEKNARGLRRDLQPWTTAARRTPRSKTGTTTRVVIGVDSAAVLAWAASNGIELSTRGRLPRHVIDQYRAAGN